MDASAALQVLRTVAAFSRLPNLSLQAIAEQTIERRFPAGTALMRQGDDPDGLYVIASGTADVILRRGGESQVLHTALPGTVLGEMALVTHAPRNADVVATSDTTALFLSGAAFTGLAARLPELLGVLTDIVAQRLGRAAQDGLGDKVLDGFRVIRPVGRGATAVVYEGLRIGDGATVALKMLSHALARDELAMSWFDREADLLERVAHPNVASCRGRFPAYGTRFLVIDFVDGPSLLEAMRRLGAVSEPETRRIAGSLAEALRFVHERGIVHGDVKPANAMLATDGRVLLTDFGIAATVDEIAAGDGRTDSIRISGTPRYMAPEMFFGAPRSAATDQYALGCVLWEMLTGRPVFDVDQIGPLVMAKRALDPDEVRAALHMVSPEIAGVAASLLAASPARRAAAASELASMAGPADRGMIARVVRLRSAG